MERLKSCKTRSTFASSNSINTVWYVKIDGEFFNKFREMNEKRDLVRSEARFFKSYLGRVRVHSTSFQSKSCGKRSSIQVYTYKKEKRDNYSVLSTRYEKLHCIIFLYIIYCTELELLNIKFKIKLNLDFFLCVIFLIMTRYSYR